MSAGEADVGWWTDPAGPQNTVKRKAHFNRLKRGRGAAHVAPDHAGLNALLAEHVARRFERLTGLSVAVGSINLADLSVESCPSTFPPHAACADLAGAACCCSAWSDHIDEFRHAPEPHWHLCDCGMWCAVVPLVWCKECIAASRLVCPGSVEQDRLAQHVELLDILVGGFATTFADFLAELTGRAEAAARSAPTSVSSAQFTASHPKVRSALAHIEERLVDPGLTVASIARAIGANTTYLSHLFAEEMGMRMSRYIAARRIDLAKKLLVTKDWQIKHIAHRTGHGNAEWFSEVFREHTGITPTKYRRAHQVP